MKIQTQSSLGRRVDKQRRAPLKLAATGGATSARQMSECAGEARRKGSWASISRGACLRRPKTFPAFCRNLHRGIRYRACHVREQFPVDKRYYSYGVMWNAFRRLAAKYSADEKADLFVNAARETYRSPAVNLARLR